MPAAAVVGAVVAIAGAGSITAAAGIGSAVAIFSIIGAVGATAGAIGALTKVKELQYAGAALGAVGLIGGLASAAGLFGEAGSLFGSAAEVGGAVGEVGGFGSWMGGAADIASGAATDAGTWAGVSAAATPTAGYADIGSGVASVPQVDYSGFDAINMANGLPPTAAAPTVAPDVLPAAATDQGIGLLDRTLAEQGRLAYDNATPLFDLPSPDPGGVATTAAETTTPFADGSRVTGLADVPDPARSILPQDYGLDNSGNMIPQGGGEQVPGDLGAGARNPDAPTSVFNNPVSGSPTPSGIAGTQPPATGLVNAVPGPPGGYSATLPPGASSTITAAASNPNTPLIGNGQSVWGDITDWVQRNQTLSYGAMQAIGSFVSGAFKQDPAGTLEALQAQQAANLAAQRRYDQETALLQRRLQNMGEPIPVATRGPRPGLINAGGTVTGRVG